jgi:hypothetical protein
MPLKVGRAGYASRAPLEETQFERSRLRVLPGLIGLVALLDIVAAVMSLAAI